MTMNANYAIVTDAFSNLPGKLLKTLDIQILPCTYYVEDVPVQYSGDIETFDAHTYYDQIRNGKMIRTSLVNADLFMDAFRPVLASGKDVLYVGLSPVSAAHFRRPVWRQKP
jgi:fatty acid-binding protein DegV